MEELKSKVQNLISKSSYGLFEREEVIKLAYLALLSGESIFLLGPPGTAKSLVSRKIKHAMKEARSFEYLMSRFSTPDEIFGPISLMKLEMDEYERKVDGFLPNVEIAFLDEIWKASPAIQNALLTILNEKTYKNGKHEIKVPLKLFIAASNELPAKNEGLEAIFDRFLIRAWVGNISKKSSFKDLLQSKSTEAEIKDNEKLSFEEIKDCKLKSQDVELPNVIFNFIDKFRNQLNSHGDKAPYISDRRWRKIVDVLRVSAFISNRQKIDHNDLPLMIYLIWENTDQLKLITEVFSECYQELLCNIKGFMITDNIKTVENLTRKASLTSKATKKHETYKNIDHDFENVLYGCFTITGEKTTYSFPIEETTDGYVPRDNDSKYYTYYTKELIVWKANHSTKGEFTKKDGKWFFKEKEIFPIEKESKNFDRQSLSEIKEKYAEIQKTYEWINNGWKLYIKETLNLDNIFISNTDEIQKISSMHINSNVNKLWASLETLNNKIKEVENNA